MNDTGDSSPHTSGAPRSKEGGSAGEIDRLFDEGHALLSPCPPPHLEPENLTPTPSTRTAHRSPLAGEREQRFPRTLQ